VYKFLGDAITQTAGMNGLSFMLKIFDLFEMTIFDEEMLRPETQGMDAYVDGINNIVETQQKVAKAYFEDGSIDDACPPLRALLYIMAEGQFQGRDVHDPEIRQMFTREYLLESDWYRERLQVKQQREIALWQRHIRSLEDFIARPHYAEVAKRMDLEARLECARGKLKQVESQEYLDNLVGTIGADPLAPAREGQQQQEYQERRIA
jgi:hypothetical protein